MKVKNEKGTIITVALIFLVLLSFLGIMATKTAQTEIQCAGNHYRHTQAFYHAEAGINTAWADLKNILSPYKHNWDSLPEFITINNGNYNFPGEFFVEVIPKRDSDNNVILWGDTNNNGTLEENKTVGYPIITLRSTGRSAGAEAQIEALLRMDILFGEVPSPLYVGGNQLEQNGSSAKAIGEYFISASECPEVTNLNNIADVVTTSDADPALDADNFNCTTNGQLTCGSVKTLKTNQPEYPILQTINNFKKSATIVSNVGVTTSNLTLGSQSNPGVFYVKDLLNVNNITVYGVLLVEGTTVLSGNIHIEGIAFVSGDSRFDGGGSKEMYGAFLTAGNALINGSPEFLYDCRKVNNISDTYNKYVMLSWAQN